jgi:hypothetical protein
MIIKLHYEFLKGTKGCDKLILPSDSTQASFLTVRPLYERQQEFRDVDVLLVLCCT